MHTYYILALCLHSLLILHVTWIGYFFGRYCGTEPERVLRPLLTDSSVQVHTPLVPLVMVTTEHRVDEEYSLVQGVDLCVFILLVDCLQCW